MLANKIQYRVYLNVFVSNRYLNRLWKMYQWWLYVWLDVKWWLMLWGRKPVGGLGCSIEKYYHLYE